jgi:hypothetical protein
MFRRAGWLAFLAAGLGILPSVTQADDMRPTVIELYTSQGCSSCPPADAILADLAKRDGVIALALHVDYWDYIGWKDTFGDPAFTHRQKSYARAAGEKMVYTPQMVVNGTHMIVGVDAAGLVQLLKPADEAQTTAMQVERAGNRLTVRVSTSAPLANGAVVHLVRFIPMAAVTIKRGENAGRTIDYANVVTSWQDVASWDGRSALKLTLDVPGALPAAVLVQEPGPGRILAAAVSP